MAVQADRPKYQQVADRIEAEMQTGRWDNGRDGRMPSVRGIADQYNVSIVTASRALQVLRDKGLIQSRERSGTFRLPAATAERWAVVLRLTPGPMQPAVAGQSRAGFEAVARREPMHLHYDAFTFGDSLAPADAERAARAAVANGVHGVFLLPSRAADADAGVDAAFLGGCRAAGLPVVLLERGLRGDDTAGLDLVTLDNMPAAAALTRHLMSLGKKRVAIAVASPTTTHNERVAGYLYALHQAGGGGRRGEYPELVVRLPEELPTAAAVAALADRVQKDRVDGVVCYHDYIALGLILELLTRGAAVPGDVAVCGFEGIDIGSFFPLGLTTYSYPADAMAEQAVRLMRERLREPARPPVRVVVPGAIVVRGSTDPEYVPGGAS